LELDKRGGWTFEADKLNVRITRLNGQVHLGLDGLWNTRDSLDCLQLTLDIGEVGHVREAFDENACCDTRLGPCEISLNMNTMNTTMITTCNLQRMQRLFHMASKGIARDPELEEFCVSILSATKKLRNMNILGPD